MSTARDQSTQDAPSSPTLTDASTSTHGSYNPPRSDRSTQRPSGPDSHISVHDFSNIRRRHTNAPSSQDHHINQMSPGDTDRVFPIRSVVSVDPSSTPLPRSDRQDSYFHGAQPGRRDRPIKGNVFSFSTQGQGEESATALPPSVIRNPGPSGPRLPLNHIDGIVSGRDDASSVTTDQPDGPRSAKGDAEIDDLGDLVTSRFTHVVTAEGHAIITGRDGEIQRCEDEPIHMPGAIQSFGLLIALQEVEGKFVVRVVSENSYTMLGFTPKQLFSLDSFTDILSEEQADNLLDHIDFVKDVETDVERDGPELFTLSIKPPHRRTTKFWCAMHTNNTNKGILICELELETDTKNPPAPLDERTPDYAADTLDSNPSAEEFHDSTENMSKPLRVLRSARKSNRGEAAAMEVFNIMSQVQEQLAAASTLDHFLKVLVGVVKELTGFHRVMIYQFDKQWNGRVVTELLDPRATKDLYKGLHFPASDIPKQARELYRVNRVRLLYDRDQETARLVCRTMDDLEHPLDLTHSYLRAMSPIHIKYLANMAVRASMSISINAFDELWGLISCHTYGAHGMRVSFPIRKMCRLVGDTASRNIERLSYASRLQARKLINTVPTQSNPSGYIIASSEDLLKLFDADFGLLCIKDETKMLGAIEQSQEVLVMLEYLKVRKLSSVTTSQDIAEDFPDLNYPPGFQILAGMLLVPLSSSGRDFIAFFRRGQLREVKWAGNPYEKVIRSGTNAFLEPRKSFKVWSETVVGKCRDWTEEEVETAAVLCLVYGKFIEVWRQKEAALQTSQLTKLLLANSAHEVRTPLNAIINYLEIALEGSLDQDTREYLAKSHSASKSLIYVINDLLDLTKTEEGVDLITGDVFNLEQIFKEATGAYSKDAQRKGIKYEVFCPAGLPKKVFGDQRKVRQAISNVIANAVKHTSKGSVVAEAYVTSRKGNLVNIEIIVQDTGSGMSTKKLDALFRDLEQVQSDSPTDNPFSNSPNATKIDKEATLGLGLAIVARIVRNMNGQLRLKSEEGVGSRFVIQLPFDSPDAGDESEASGAETPTSTVRPSFRNNSTEVLLVEQDNCSTVKSPSPQMASRKNSSESLMSRKSVRSVNSMGSAASGRSDVDRLIEALQEPQMVDTNKRGSQGHGGASSSRPGLETRKTYSMGSASQSQPQSQSQSRSQQQQQQQQSRSMPYPGPVLGQARTNPNVETRGEKSIASSLTPIRAVRMQEDDGVPLVETSDPTAPSGVMGEVVEGSGRHIEAARPTADCMCVLVAEDDPVNSRIVKKRLEKLGHEVHMTVNGEDCATAYSENPDKFDVVLMDMQMPIVDGLTSTKMIRSQESSSNVQSRLSTRAALNGRIPVIAVSASLVENDRQTYIDAGFDAWILKPINFVRLKELMIAIVDPNVRKGILYKPGDWEKGGYFGVAHPAATNITKEGDGASRLKSRSEPQLRRQSEDSQAQQPSSVLGRETVESPASTNL